MFHRNYCILSSDLIIPQKVIFIQSLYSKVGNKKKISGVIEKENNTNIGLKLIFSMDHRTNSRLFVAKSRIFKANSFVFATRYYKMYTL